MADTTEHASKDDSFKRALRPDQVQGPVAAQEYEGSQGGRDLTSATVGNPTNSERTAQAANGNTRTGKTEIPRAEDAVEAIKRADSVTDIPNGDGQVQSGSKKTNPRKHKKPSKTMRRQGSIRGRSLVSQSSSTESSESSTSSNSSSEEEPEDLRKRDKRPKRRTNRKPPGSSSIDREMDSEDSTKNTQESSDAQILALQHQVAQLTQICTALQQSISPPATAFYGGVHPGNPMLHLYPPATSLGLAHSPAVPPHSLPRSHIASKSSKRDRKPLGDLEKPLHASRAKSGETPNSLLEESVREKRVDFKRVDWVWDSSRYAYKLQDSAENANDSQYDGYIFHVRRSFDVEGKYRATTVDIKSKLLRECLQDVIGDIKGPSLVDETPKLDPNLLFLYLEDLRTHRKNLRHVKPAGDTKKERKRNQTRLDSKREQLKVLLTYLDKDYADVKESLYPMLENGLITFDLLWALWKPGTMAYTTTYGSSDDPRVFKVEQAEKHRSFMKGELYHLEGKYFEFDGKGFGHGTMTEEVLAFRGARRITSLPCYPLEYYENEQQLREKLIKRGQKFVSLHGVHYKSYSGMAYHKTKKSTIKFNIQQSRIMVDAAIFRRINPNYSVSPVRSKEPVLTFGGMSDEDSDAVDDSDSYDTGRRVVTKVLRARNLAAVMADGGSSDTESGQSLEPVASMPSSGPDSLGSRTEGHSAVAKDDPPTFSEEEYLMASPVVLGFSFAEKQWLEFTVDGVEEISWNDTAWDSLVSEPGTKDLIQALVKSRKYHAANTIDDVIRGKGKGLVTVLHGPPGTGKTLTAEGISELLKCPLYMVSAGELGTDSRCLEAELQKILDICHAWGAILLLDEADVFLEKRNMMDIHRNALVSIFLRQLEYFQGILFLTTNRVETFDEAFQSRIHIALRYGSLETKAKKAIFKMFIERVQTYGKLKVVPFSDDELDDLSRKDLNGREIKNVVSSAQDLAINKDEALSMKHIRQVLDVHAKFGRDLNGGTGFEEAMRSYF